MVKTCGLSELCNKYGVSAAKLSRLSGKSPSTLYRWYAEENPILELMLVGFSRSEELKDVIVEEHKVRTEFDVVGGSIKFDDDVGNWSIVLSVDSDDA